MDRHVQNAQAVAEFLAEHPVVSWVNYPGLPASSPYHALAAEVPAEGCRRDLLTFGIKGGREAGARFIESLQLISHLANVGDAKTLVIHPASTTHQQLSDDEQRAAGRRPGLIRLSIGLEDGRRYLLGSRPGAHQGGEARRRQRGGA